MSEDKLVQPSVQSSDASKTNSNAGDPQFNQPVSTVSRLKKLEERVEALEAKIEILQEAQQPDAKP